MRKLFISFIIATAVTQSVAAASVGANTLAGVANAEPETSPSLSNDSKPDSTVWGYADGTLRYKYFYKYDANRNKIQEIEHYYDFGRLSGVDSTSYTYDANGNCTSREYYSHKADETQWKVSGKVENTYDNDNVMTSYTLYNVKDDALVPAFKEEYTFDDHKNRTVYASWYWNDIDNDWDARVRYDYTYNSADKCTGYLAVQCVDQVWVNALKYEAIYDGNNNPTFQANYTWTDGAWVLTGRNEATYDEKNNIATKVTYTSYNGKEVQLKYVYTYDDRGYKTGQMQYTWSDDAWTESFKAEYTCDDHGNETSVSNYITDPDGWYPYSRYEYEYNSKDEQISRAEMSWSLSDEQWYYHDKWKYTFDEEGYKTGYIKYQFYGDEHYGQVYRAFTAEELEKHPYRKDEYTFDENHNVLSEDTYDWSYEGTWDLDSYVNYYYNSPSDIQSVGTDTDSGTRVRTVMKDGRLIIIASHDKQYDIVGKQLK